MEAIVEFEYIAQEEDELTLKVGEIITNISKTSEGWCEGTLNGRRGMFPDNFVKEIKKEVKVATPAKRQNTGAVSDIRSKLSSVILPGGIPPPAVSKKPLKRAKVTFAYAPQQDDELMLEVGTVIEILKQEDPNWWEGSLNGKIGMFPSNFVEILNQAEGDKPGLDEVSEIRGRKVEGVGFGNIFAGGQIVLRSKVEKKDSVDPTKDKSPIDPKPPQVKLKPAVPTPAPQAASQVKSVVKPVLRARVIFPYTASNDDEIDLMEGDIIVVLDQNLEDDGWWKGELNGKIGVFPDNFVELLPAETEKPPKPSMPPPPSINSIAAKTAGAAANVPSTDPQKAKMTKKDEPKSVPPAVNRPLPEMGKQPDLKPNLETDDHKAKRNKEFTRTGTLDSVKPNENVLSHPTAFRAKPPVRRPPAAGPTPIREAPLPDDKMASVAKAQPQVPLKDEHLVTSPVTAPKFPKDMAHDASSSSSSGGYASREQYTELQHEVSQLKETIDQMRKSQEKRFHELMSEIDEEKKVRLNLQVELERLKKMITSE